MQRKELFDEYTERGYITVKGAVSGSDCERLLKEMSATFEAERWLDLRTQPAPDEDRILLAKRRIDRLNRLSRRGGLSCFLKRFAFV